MDSDKLADLVNKLKKPQNIVIALIGLSLLIVLVIIVIQKLSPAKESAITENQIKVQKGDRIVLIDKNGLVEYRTSEGVFYEVWDSSKIADFFALMEALAREYLANPDSSLCNTGYTVTLYVDGKEETICISEDDETLGEVFEEFPDEDEGQDLTAFFEDDETDGGAASTPTPTPTPTPLIVSGEEGEESGSGTSVYQVLACDLYKQLVTTRTIISNTLCVAAPSPTPTPTP